MNNNWTTLEIIGAIIAVVVSWTKWHSITWAAVHGLFGWFYIIYYVCTYDN